MRQTKDAKTKTISGGESERKLIEIDLFMDEESPEDDDDDYECKHSTKHTGTNKRKTKNPAIGKDSKVSKKEESNSAGKKSTVSKQEQAGSRAEKPKSSGKVEKGSKAENAVSGKDTLAEVGNRSQNRSPPSAASSLVSTHPQQAHPAMRAPAIAVAPEPSTLPNKVKSCSWSLDYAIVSSCTFVLNSIRSVRLLDDSMKAACLETIPIEVCVRKRHVFAASNPELGR
jgi:hypothetical protein